jgi:FkbM family methyltransferase
MSEIKSPFDVVGMDSAYEADIWGRVDFDPVPAYFIDTHDPVSQDRYISASVHEAKTPWDSYIWDRIVSLTPSDASGLVFVDVGANIGYFSLAAASMGYNVVAFEPMSRNAKKLAKSIKMNEFGSRVTLYQNAVTDVSGQHVVLKETDATNQGNGQIVSTTSGTTLGTTSGVNGVYGVDYATSVTLSDALSGINAFIVKIDVEGHEGAVLQGARDWVCGNVVQHLIVEVSDATKKNSELLELLQFMISAGYVMADVAVGSSGLESVDIWSLPPNIIFTLMSDGTTC